MSAGGNTQMTQKVTFWTVNFPTISWRQNTKAKMGPPARCSAYYPLNVESSLLLPATETKLNSKGLS